jgi:hypothetical protein
MTVFGHGGISIKSFVTYVHMRNETLSHKFHPYSILSTHYVLFPEAKIMRDTAQFQLQMYFDKNLNTPNFFSETKVGYCV